MARKAWPRSSGANAPIKAPKLAADTSMHLMSIYCYGDSMREGFEVWTACGKETTSSGAQTTRKRQDVTCARCVA